jgi:hypothetical protein
MEKIGDRVNSTRVSNFVPSVMLIPL